MTGYKTNWDDVPTKSDFDEAEGWIKMQVQFGIDSSNGGATEVVFGRTVFRPGARHDVHRHANAEEIQYLMSGEGVVLDGDDEIPVRPGDVFFTPKNRWHGFRNTSSDTDAVVVWAWAGAADREQAGYVARTQVEEG